MWKNLRIFYFLNKIFRWKFPQYNIFWVHLIIFDHISFIFLVNFYDVRVAALYKINKHGALCSLLFDLSNFWMISSEAT